MKPPGFFVKTELTHSDAEALFPIEAKSPFLSEAKALFLNEAKALFLSEASQRTGQALAEPNRQGFALDNS